MIVFKRIEDTDIYEFSIDGDIDEADAEKMYSFFAEKADKDEKIKLLGIINEFPEFEAFKSFGETMKMKTKAIKSVAKYAVLTDRDWIESLLPIGNFITPGLPLKHFDLDERDEAIAWLKNDDDDSVSEEEYLSKMNVGNIRGTNIYEFTVDGEIDEGGMTALYNILKDKTRDGKVNILGYLKDFDGFDSFKSFTQGLKVDVAAFGNIDKFAIVTDKEWVRKLAAVESKIIPGITMKGFDDDEAGEAGEALEWLKNG